MNKKIALVSMLSVLLMTSTVDAYFGQNNAAKRYYSGEISTDEYLDSLGVPKVQVQQTTIYHSDGTKSLIQSNSTGGTIYHSNGSKSVYSTSR